MGDNAMSTHAAMLLLLSAVRSTALPVAGRGISPAESWGLQAANNIDATLASGKRRLQADLKFVHGGADFRGKHGSFFSFFSAPNLAVNVKTEGGAITSAHLVARVGGAKRELLNVSFWADELNQFNTGWKLVNGTCDGDFFRLGLGASMSCEEAVIKVEYASATFEVKEWVVHVKGDNVSDRLSGPHHKLDIAFSAKNVAPERFLPHGIIGESLSSPDLRLGTLTPYPTEGHFAVGFAETVEDGLKLYELPSAYATDFVFSRFDDAERTVMPGLVDADSHGVRSSFLSFFSAPNLAVNVKTEGGAITSAHLVARVGGAKRELLNVSFWADELNQFNTGWKLVNGTCDGDFFRLGLGASMSCEEAVIKVEYASATFEVKEWVVHVKGDNVSDRLSGPHHKLDIAFSARNAAPGALNARPGLAVGFAESALAKEGLQQQELPFAFATDFATSRFDDVERAASTRVGADPKSPPWGSLFGKVLGNVKALAGETEKPTHNAENAKEAKLLQRLVAEA